jgi:hypothetical protein
VAAGARIAMCLLGHRRPAKRLRQRELGGDELVENCAGRLGFRRLDCPESSAWWCNHPPALLRPQPINQLVIQTQNVRELVGFGENRLGFRSGAVGEVLEVGGERTVVQVERWSALSWRVVIPKKYVMPLGGSDNLPG